MRKIRLFGLFGCLLFMVGCQQSQQVAQPTVATPSPSVAGQVANPQASVSASIAVVPRTVAPLNSPAGSTPAAPTTPPSSGAKIPGTGNPPKEIPAPIWDRMTRGLTLEEINNLPPDARDRILRAQGRHPDQLKAKGAPTPPPAKK